MTARGKLEDSRTCESSGPTHDNSGPTYNNSPIWKLGYYLGTIIVPRSCC